MEGDEIEENRQHKRAGTDINEVEKEVRNCISSDRICVWGIEKFYDPKQCYKFFIKNFGMHPQVTHICKFKNKSFFIVKFNTEINIEEFNTKYAKNKRNKVKPLLENMHFKQEDFLTIEECARPQQKKQSTATPQQYQKIVNTPISQIVQPLQHLPYAQQVQSKIQDINRVIQNYNRAFFKDPQVNRLIKDGIKINQLKLNQFIQCTSDREGYRSKSEFTVGKDRGGVPVIGFNKGSYHNNTIMVQTPRNVHIISKSTKLIVAILQNYIKMHATQLHPFDRIEQSGFWRYVVVRQSQRLNEFMVIVVVRQAGVDPLIVKQTKEGVVDALKKGVIGLVSVGWLDYAGQADSIPTQKPEIIYGTPFYHQKILNRVFTVSPSAFLQIHIPMCQILYERIIKSVADCDIVLDLGCGIGTIGISIVNSLKEGRGRLEKTQEKQEKQEVNEHKTTPKVIGVQICQEAVEDAKRNAQGLQYDVILGRVQDHIKRISEQYHGNKIVAILDPPRAGFNKDVLTALRRCRGLDNLVYVACKAGAIQDNLLTLTLPMTDRRRAPEFIIQSMVGFDLFPGTSHYQVLYTLKRVR